jgi:hypothetical protein
MTAGSLYLRRTIRNVKKIAHFDVSTTLETWNRQREAVTHRTVGTVGTAGAIRLIVLLYDNDVWLSQFESILFCTLSLKYSPEAH